MYKKLINWVESPPLDESIGKVTGQTAIGGFKIIWRLHAGKVSYHIGEAPVSELEGSEVQADNHNEAQDLVELQFRELLLSALGLESSPLTQAILDVLRQLPEGCELQGYSRELESAEKGLNMKLLTGKEKIILELYNPQNDEVKKHARL